MPSPSRRTPSVALLAVLLLSGAPLATSSLEAQEAGNETLADCYREVAGRLIGAALTDDEWWEKLVHLTTTIGHRLSGSPGLEEAIRWAGERMRAEGLENVTLQPVMVPHCVRGRESARVVAPIEKELAILGLGNSVGTPPEGLEAPVVVVGSFDELRALGREGVEGRIVVYAVEWEGYGRTGLRPRRTLRVVLWTNEENGGRGARAYRDSLGDAVGDHVAAIEMDGGAERPVGFGVSLGAGARGGPPGRAAVGAGDEEPDPALEAALEKLREIGRLLEGIDAGRITAGGGGADIAPLMREGVPGLALRTVGEHYFDWHHTNADTIDKVEPESFRRAVAMLAVMGYALADMPGRLGEAPRP